MFSFRNYLVRNIWLKNLQGIMNNLKRQTKFNLSIQSNQCFINTKYIEFLFYYFEKLKRLHKNR